MAAGGIANQVLTKVDATDFNTQWVDPSIPPETLEDLTDVDLGTPSDGQVLTFSSGEWTNAQPTGTWGLITGALENQGDLKEVLTSLAHIASTTGVTRTSDSAGLTALSDTVLRINALQQGIFYNQLNAGVNNAVRTFAQQDWPLSNLGLSTDGFFIRYIGYLENGDVVVSNDNLNSNSNALQLGYILVKRVGGVTTFIDGAAGPRNAHSQPDFAGNTALLEAFATAASDVFVEPKGSLTVRSSSGLVKGESINWGSGDVNVRAVGAQDPTTFTTYNPGTMLSTTAPTPGSTVQVTQFWNGTAMQTLGNNNRASVQRFLVSIRGQFALQVGEVEYSSYQDAIDNINFAPFTELFPQQTFIELCRFASTRGTVNLQTGATFIYGQGGSGTGGGAAGTVTSVDASGATTGLTFTGGPVTSTGVLTLGGTLAIGSGGTGATTANDALNALLPAQPTHEGEALLTDGTNSYWGLPVSSSAQLLSYRFVTATTPPPAGGDIRYNNATQTAATHIFVNKITAGTATDLTNYYRKIVPNTVFLVQSRVNNGQYHRWNITAVVEQSTYFDWTVELLDASGAPFGNNTNLVVGYVFAGSETLDLTDLGDVTITTPISSQVLSYNGSQWVNAASAAGSTNQLQYNNAGVLTGTTGITYSTANGGHLKVGTGNALLGSTTNSTVFGAGNGINSGGSLNTYVGFEVAHLLSGGGGGGNTFIGARAGRSAAVNSSQNVLVGADAGISSSGSGSVVIGSGALFGSQTGTGGNVIIGMSAGGSKARSGSLNILIGRGAGFDLPSSASSVVLIGGNDGATLASGEIALSRSGLTSGDSPLRLVINNAGAFGIGGSNYGTSGQVLTSAGTEAPPTWSSVVGEQGPPGPQGDPGPVGPQGIQGDTGLQGDQGIQGEPGADGATGATGATGPQGDPGPAGPQGEVGPEGPQGDQGPQGIQGVQGEVGPEGPQGIQGDTGATGTGVAPGGSANQVLAKVDATDFNTQWVDAGGGSGTVTSVGVTSSDLTVGGSPVTTSGTITLALNTVPVAKGGTGSTTAPAALTALGAYPATNPSGFTANTGTVTSVEVGSVNGALSISGTPITSAGIISITANTFTTVQPGVVPGSGGGTTNFLRADGTWAATPATPLTPGGADTNVQFNNAGVLAGGPNFTFNFITNGLTLGTGSGGVTLIPTGIGTLSLKSSPLAANLYESTFIGMDCAISRTSGDNNTYLGCGSGANAITGNGSTGFGAYTLNQTTGAGNTAVGASAMRQAATTTDSTAIGKGAGRSLGAVSGAVVIGSDDAANLLSNELVLTVGTEASPVRRLRINTSGAFGIGGTAYGTSGQVLTSAGTGGPPTWTTVGGSGTVTSVAATSANSAISVSGSPVTTSGTLALTSNAFTSSTPGHVPASGGGTTTFLRADGTFAAPAAAAPTGIPQNLQTTSYTCVLGDAGKHIYNNSASGVTFTIPSNASVAYGIGTTLTFVNKFGGGTVTLAITTDTMYFAPSGATGSRTISAPALVTAIKVTATTWIVSGSGIT